MAELIEPIELSSHYCLFGQRQLAAKLNQISVANRI